MDYEKKAKEIRAEILKMLDAKNSITLQEIRADLFHVLRC